MSLLDQAAADPDAPAVDDPTRRRTRGELLDRARPPHPTGKLYTRLVRDRYWSDRATSV